MLRRFIKQFIAVGMILIFGFSYAYADMGSYMSNIMSQISSLSPQAYQSQQRGYFVGGTMHIPPLGETIQPFSVTLPALQNNSCGSINAMMGGFSYLNFQYLVQKLQGIIQAAPALAFEIAIKVLSEKLGGVMNGLEQITDAINGLNFNSCTAMNGIVNAASTAITNAIQGSAEGAANQQASGSSDWFGQGITNFIPNVEKGWNTMMSALGITNSGGTMASNPNLATSGTVPTNGVLNFASSQMGIGLPSNFIDVMRYYVGDVMAAQGSVTGANGTSVPTATGQYYAPCDSNANDMIKSLANGNSYAITYDQLLGGECGGISETTAPTSLVQVIQNDMEEIYQALSTNTPLTDPNAVSLINMSSIPVYSFMQQAAILQNGVADQLIDELSRPIAYNIVANVISKLIGVTDQLVAQVAAGAKTNTSGINNQSYLKALRTFQKNIRVIQQQVINQQYTAYKNAETIYGSFQQQYKELNGEVQAQLNTQGGLLKKAMAVQHSLGR